jgi:hypothetical protein
MYVITHITQADKIFLFADEGETMFIFFHKSKVDISKSQV